LRTNDVSFAAVTNHVAWLEGGRPEEQNLILGGSFLAFKERPCLQEGALAVKEEPCPSRRAEPGDKAAPHRGPRFALVTNQVSAGVRHQYA